MSNPGLLADIRDFILHRPAIPTLVEYTTRAERQDYGQRIMQPIT